MYKGKIVNFELLYVDGEFIDDESLANVTYNMVMADIVRAADQGFDVIVGLLLMDGFLYKDNEIFYRNLKRIQKQAFKFGIKKIMLVTGMCEDFQHHLASKGLNYEIGFFDFTHHMVYQSYLGKEDLLPNWNYKSKKFLFLGGVPSRKNRINLLSKFYDKKLLDFAEWSFFRPWTTEDQWWCRAALDHYTDEQYEQFLKDCDRAVDYRYQEAKNYSRLPGKDLKETNIHDTDWCKDPSWIDPSVFDSTLFSVISEGNAYPPATDFRFLTEKTWRTVIMKHPFVFAGEPEQFHYAKSKGLKTFENYMLIDDYADITYEDHRLDAVVKNTEKFLVDAENNIDQIQQDIEHNFQIFLDVAKYNQSLLDHLQDDYNVDPNEIERWFNHKSFVHLIRIANGN
jgi:hypothetical protein